MKTLSRFVVKFSSLIVAVLSCFDRVIFKRDLPISNGPVLEGFVDHVLKIRRNDFMAFAEKQSETLADHAKRLAREAGAEYRFLQRKPRKDELVDEILRQRSILEGLICVFSCMECDTSFQLDSGPDRPRLVNKRRQQRVLYFDFFDPELGPIHIRLPIWFPCSVQVWLLEYAAVNISAKDILPTFRTSDPSFLRIFILSSDNTMWMICGNGRTSAGARSGGLSIPATRGYRT